MFTFVHATPGSLRHHFHFPPLTRAAFNSELGVDFKGIVYLFFRFCPTSNGGRITFETGNI